MKQAAPTNIITGPWAHPFRTPSTIELLWNQHEAATSQKARIYAEAEDAFGLTANGNPAADAAADRAEAATNAAYDALENIGDKILRARATSATDLAIKARILALRDFRTGYHNEDVQRLCVDVQTFATFA
jgi:hypothetical protein